MKQSPEPGAVVDQTRLSRGHSASSAYLFQSMGSLYGFFLETFGLCDIDKEKAVQILSYAFRNDAFHRYVLLTWKGSRASPLSGVALNQVFFNELLSQLESDGAFYLSVPGSRLAMVCQPVLSESCSSPPQASEDDETPTALLEMEAESQSVLQSLYDPGCRVLHIYLIGKGPCADRLGTTEDIGARDLLNGVARLAASQGWPLYLEATSTFSRDLFKSVGFELAQGVKVGVGRVSEEGMSLKNGPGVTLWVLTLESGLPSGITA